MPHSRAIERIIKSKPTIEGAGVHLRRVFGYYERGLLDPFLLLDHFSSDDPKDYVAGFPWHPHRGIETVTYMIDGTVEHGDSLGNTGAIHSGDVQWMTAGSGIIHQEMPKSYEGTMRGFQLWVNLPKEKKMMRPRYRGIAAHDIPEVELDNKVKVKIISGEKNGTRGPLRDLVVDSTYLDIRIPAKTRFVNPIHPEHTAFAFVFEGEGFFDDAESKVILPGTLALFDRGNTVTITTKEKSVRFLLVSGKPIGEPIAWRGPIVMNTEDELSTAFEEYYDGTFIKESGVG